MDVVIDQAVRECNDRRIIGKNITPFLLQRVGDITKGRSLIANIALIENNARVAAEIAVALASLENTSSVPPPIVDASKILESPRDSPTDVMVIGSMAADVTCTLPNISSHSMPLYTSHPANTHTSVGGVAHNVALATCYASSHSVRLVTALGADPGGNWLRGYAQNIGLDVAFVSGETETARYVAIHDKHGELITAAADMRIIEGFKEEEIQREIRRGKPKFLAFDGNISPAIVKTILEECDSETKSISQRDMY